MRMRGRFYVLIGFMLGAALVTSAVVSFMLFEQRPRIEALKRDIYSNSASIEQAKRDILLYQTGTAIHSLIAARLQTLELTSALLKQRETSILHRITISYNFAQNAADPPTEIDVASLESELSRLREQIRTADAEAARFSGGLLQTTSLLVGATHRMTASLVEQRLILARNGIRMPLVPMEQIQTRPMSGPSTNSENPGQAERNEEIIGGWRLSRHTDRLTDAYWFNAFLYPIEGNRDTFLRIQCNRGVFHFNLFSPLIRRNQSRNAGFDAEISYRIGRNPSLSAYMNTDQGTASFFDRIENQFIDDIQRETQLIFRIEVRATNEFREVVYDTSKTDILISRMRGICLR